MSIIFYMRHLVSYRNEPTYLQTRPTRPGQQDPASKIRPARSGRQDPANKIRPTCSDRNTRGYR